MHSFKDKTGTSWLIELNVGTARRVKAQTGVDIVNVLRINQDGTEQHSPLEQIAEDPFLLVSVICALCSNQMTTLALTEETFAERFTADTIEQATNALIEEIINFSRPATRKILTKIYQTSNAMAEKQNKQLDSILNSPEFEHEIRKQWTQSSTDTPASSD